VPRRALVSFPLHLLPSQADNPVLKLTGWPLFTQDSSFSVLHTAQSPRFRATRHFSKPEVRSDFGLFASASSLFPPLSLSITSPAAVRSSLQPARLCLRASSAAFSYPSLCLRQFLPLPGALFCRVRTGGSLLPGSLGNGSLSLFGTQMEGTRINADFCNPIGGWRTSLYLSTYNFAF
jgi:hypothetical protein